MAYAAGPAWWQRMENAWRMMNPAKTREELRPGVQLLLDLRDLFARDGRARWSTAELITALIQGEDGTGDTIWAEMPALREGALGGKALTQTQLAFLLRRYGIKKRRVRDGSSANDAPAAGFIFPRISMMPSPGISRLAAPVRATNRVAERRQHVVRGGRAAEETRRRRRPTTSPRNGSREDSNHASDRTTCGPRLFSGTRGPPNRNQALHRLQTTPTGVVGPIRDLGPEPRPGSARRSRIPVWDQLSCRWRFQELNPLNNQAGPVVPENRPGPHQ